MERKVIYIESDYIDTDEFLSYDFDKLTNDEKLKVANNDNNMIVYSLEGFMDAFNEGFISDLGYIFIV